MVVIKTIIIFAAYIWVWCAVELATRIELKEVEFMIKIDFHNTTNRSISDFQTLISLLWKSTNYLVYVTGQHYISIFFTRGLCTNLCFSSTRIAWGLTNTNVIFLLSRLIFACRLLFLFIRIRISWESWNSWILCIKKQRFAHRP